MAQIPTAPADPLFWLHHCMVDYNWYKWENIPVRYSGSLEENLPPWNYQVKNIFSLSFRAAKPTKYPGIDKLPIDDHCSVCYRDPPVKSNIVDFRNRSIDEVLVKNFSPEELKRRKSDDYWVLKILEANPAYTQVDLINKARNGCDFNLPMNLIESIEELDMNVNDTKLEFCDIILTPIFEGSPVILIYPLGDVENTTSETYIETELLVTEEMLRERLERPSTMPTAPPSSKPSQKLSSKPSQKPSSQPSQKPSSKPSQKLSSKPSQSDTKR